MPATSLAPCSSLTLRSAASRRRRRRPADPGRPVPAGAARRSRGGSRRGRSVLAVPVGLALLAVQPGRRGRGSGLTGCAIGTVARRRAGGSGRARSPCEAGTRGAGSDRGPAVHRRVSTIGAVSAVLSVGAGRSGDLRVSTWRAGRTDTPIGPRRTWPVHGRPAGPGSPGGPGTRIVDGSGPAACRRGPSTGGGVVSTPAAACQPNVR